MEYDKIISNRKRYRIISGIYFLIKDKEIIYVGNTVDLHQRLKVHSKDKDFDSYNFIKEKSRDKRLVLEYEFIKKFTPKLNKTTSNTGNVLLKELDRLEKVRVNIDIESKLWTEVKIKCIHLGIKENVFVEAALKEYIKGLEEKGNG